MRSDIVVTYCKAVLGSAIRVVFAACVVVALNLLLNPGLLDAGSPARRLFMGWLARVSPYWPSLAALIGLALVMGPWAAFRVAQWRQGRSDKSAMLPDQQRELALALAADDALELALRVLRDDPALYAIQLDRDAKIIGARATSLGRRSTLFARSPVGLAHSPASSDHGSPETSGERWPPWLLHIADSLHLCAPSRRVTLAVHGDGPQRCVIRLRSRMHTLLPVIDVLSRNRRHLDAIANAIMSGVQPLLARQREAQERAQLQRRLDDARLQVLRAQIEPHFLYNTLANVQYLIRSDPTAADAMVGALIDYLRAALPRMRGAASTLGDELALARAYLDILRIRMGSRLAVAIDAPEALAAHPFPPMMLISLAENAIKHGLEPKPGGGRIAIGVTADARSLHVAVTDTGVGFGPSAGTGIGLRNIRQTLATLFADAARLDVEPGAAGGVVATIVIPRQVTADVAHAAAAFADSPAHTL